MSNRNPQSSSLNHTPVPMPTPSPSSASRSDEDRAHALLSLSIALIDSALDVLNQHLTTDEQLTRESLLMPGGTLGKHFRHVIESFQAFLLPLQQQQQQHQPDSGAGAGSMEINYDAIIPSSRKPIARSIQSCRNAMRGVRDNLSEWGDRASRSKGKEVDVMPGTSVAGADASGSGSGSTSQSGLASQMENKVVVLAITPTRQVMTSSLGRELWYCSLHAIHHFSMLRTIAVHEHGLELPVEFGTAPSTLLYRGLGWKPPAEKKEIRVVKAKL